MKGSIYRIRHDPTAKGHEQRGRRFAVVVQATHFEHLSGWAVVPTSSSPNAHPGLLHPTIDWGAGESVVLCDGIKSIDPSQRLGDHIGTVRLAEMQAIERALQYLLDLS